MKQRQIADNEENTVLKEYLIPTSVLDHLLNNLHPLLLGEAMLQRKVATILLVTNLVNNQNWKSFALGSCKKVSAIDKVDQLTVEGNEEGIHFRWTVHK